MLWKHINLEGTRWDFILFYFIKNKIGTQICLDENLNLGSLGIHLHHQPTELAQLPRSKVAVICKHMG